MCWLTFNYIFIAFQRKSIVAGDYEPTDEEATWVDPSGEDEDEEKDKEEKKDDDNTKVKENKSEAEKLAVSHGFSGLFVIIDTC